MEAPSWERMEEVELRAWEDVYRVARERGVPGHEMVRLGMGAAVFSPGMDILSMNRAFGLAPDRVPLAELGSALVDAFRVRDVPRFFLQPLPGTLGPDAEDTLTALGYRPYDRWVRLHRAAGEVPWVLTDLDVVAAGPHYADAFGEIVRHCFGYPDFAAPWMAALVGRPGWHAFVALEGPMPVATGAFHVQGPLAWLGFSATLPGYRGRGAQLAVISEMVLQATRVGCRHLVVETAEDGPDHPAPAYRNGLRLGFREAYRRENWVWERAG